MRGLPGYHRANHARARRLLKPSLLSTCLAMLLAAPCLASRTLTDDLGYKVVVPDHPHRVICLWPSVTDTVFALGAADDVVAISDYTKYPAEALRKPSIGQILQPSIETIIAFHPDLAIGVQPSGPMEVTVQLQRLGIPIFLVNPRDIAGILHSVQSIGSALNRPAEAEVLFTRLQARVNAVRTKSAGLPPINVFLPVWYDPIITIGRHAFITDIIEAAGGRSVTDDLATDFPQISMEVLLNRSPDALLLARNGKITLHTLESRPGWSSLAAVRKRRVYYVDDRIELSSPIAIDALEDLARQFHP